MLDYLELDSASGSDPHMLRQIGRAASFSSSQHTYATAAPPSAVNYITFNQDASCIALGLCNGYKVYRCLPKLAHCFSFDRKQSIGIVEMFFTTSLIALVALGEEPHSSPRKLVVLNAKRQTTVCDLVFPSTILAVKLVPTRLLVLLETEIYLYDVSTMALIHTLETSSNPAGLCAVSTVLPGECGPSAHLYLAYPSPPKTITHDSLLATGINTNGGPLLATNNVLLVSNAPNRLGDVIIFDLVQLMPVCVIEAHKLAIAAMALSTDGKLLATASDKGTIVRVFDVDSGTKLYQFRRGTYSTHIYSLAFSNDSQFILATSSSGTVHIFRLGANEALLNKHVPAKPLHQTRVVPIMEENEPNHELESDSIGEFLDGDDSDAINDSDDEEEGEGDAEGDAEGDTENYGDADADDSAEVEESEANMPVLNANARKTATYSSLTPNPISEPVIDRNRSLVARLIRRSSQKLGRKAAQKMGDFLPSRFSLILEPTRHFASLKINLSSPHVKSIARMSSELVCDQVPLQYLAQDRDRRCDKVPVDASSQVDMQACSLLHIHVVTSDGFFYVYGLDPNRGGDCILLSQQSLLDDEK